MKVLLVASSARGHAIADALKRSAASPDIVAITPSNNPGIADLAHEHYVHDIMDFTFVLEKAKDCDLAIIGPEDPIVGGLADLLEKQSIKTVAPKKSLARIEGSKGFTRDLLKKHEIDASPAYRVFTEQSDEIRSYIENDLGGEVVVKYDGLKGGKGVKVSGDHLATTDEAVAYAEECIEEGGSVVLEGKLIGPEFSLISFVSGTQVVDTLVVQDHKRAYEGDTGPNTGGMGTVSDTNHSLPFVSKEDLTRAKEINRLVAAALEKECGEPYNGFLYGGFIVTKTGVKLIEYNCRFGDPEVLNILPLLETDFVDLCLSICDGRLDEKNVSFRNAATVCRYITPESYPVSKDQKGALVSFPEVSEDARIFYGDISREEDGLHLGGSRTAGIVGIGSTMEEAAGLADELCSRVEGPVRYRQDIGSRELMEERIKLVGSFC